MVLSGNEWRRGFEAENVFIHGPSGPGKTTLAKHAIERCREDTTAFESAYVNCISNSTETAVLYELAREAGLGADLKKDGTSSSALIDRFREHHEPIIAIVDEADALADPLVLASLYEIQLVSFVVIAVDPNQFLGRLDERVRSRVRSACQLSLRPYHHDELVDILEARAHAGLRRGAVTSEAFDYIADTAAGDARLGITLLRRAARVASEDRLREITPELVESVEADARQSMRDRRVRTLGTHQRLLFEIIHQAGRITASELHGQYETRAEDPKTRRTRRRYLESLARYDLIEQRGDGRASAYVVLSD